MKIADFTSMHFPLTTVVTLIINVVNVVNNANIHFKPS
jgi:hypothetical protein